MYLGLENLNFDDVFTFAEKETDIIALTAEY